MVLLFREGDHTLAVRHDNRCETLREGVEVSLEFDNASRWGMTRVFLEYDEVRQLRDKLNEFLADTPVQPNIQSTER